MLLKRGETINVAFFLTPIVDVSAASMKITGKCTIDLTGTIDKSTDKDIVKILFNEI